MTLLCRVEALAGGTGKGFRVIIAGQAADIFLVTVGGEVRAYLNSCPHLGIRLDWMPDRFLDRDGVHIMCATHGALFRPDDGYCIAGPCQDYALEPIAIRIADGAIYLAEPDGSSAPG